MITKSSLPAKELIKKEYYSVKGESDIAHLKIAKTFFDINSLYQKSSIMEDIVLEDFLSLLNTAKTVGSNGLLNKGYIIESYTSKDYIDLGFPTDSLLNIDIQNGDLTLPIKGTKTLEVSNVIVEKESNGRFGNSLNGGINGDINALLTSHNDSLFEYEIITSSFKTTELYFAITLKLKETDVANGLYIRTYVEEGMRYPTIDEIEISEDGETWNSALNILDLNKADHYIRFSPQYTKFARIKMSQKTYNTINTTFGIKHRYLIGLREISIRQTEYLSSGEYVSKPFTGKGHLDRINLGVDSISNNDIRYFISANNGTKWVPTTPLKPLVLENQHLGLRGDTFIDDIRLKIRMDRESSPSTVSTTENVVINTSNKYFLSNDPIDIEGYIGRYISYGDFNPYILKSEDLQTLSENGEIDQLSEDYSCNIDSARFTNILYYIPYYEGIQEDLVVRFNGMKLKNDGSVYVLTEHSDPNNTLMIFVTPIKSEGTFSFTYKPYIHDHRYSSSSTITLPQAAFLKDAGSFIVESIIYDDYLELSNQIANSEVGEKLVGNLFDDDYLTNWEADTKTLAIDEKGDFWSVQFNTADSVAIKMYSLSPATFDWQGDGLDVYKNNPISWVLEGSFDDGTTWQEIDNQQVSPLTWNYGESKDFVLESPCNYNFFRFRFFNTAQITEGFMDTCVLSVLKVYLSTNKKLNFKEDYSIIDRNTIEITKEKHNPKWDYKISYLPAVSISHLLSRTDIKNEVYIGGLTNSPVEAELAFDYTYLDPEAKKILKYYTPISKEYRIELL